jgi:hypothetical protein
MQEYKHGMVYQTDKLLIPLLIMLQPIKQCHLVVGSVVKRIFIVQIVREELLIYIPTDLDSSSDGTDCGHHCRICIALYVYMIYVAEWHFE